jgi:cytochrome c-type biogenesis protein
MVEVSYLVAFLAGIVSFLAPCVLPLVPGFLVYLAGTGAGKVGSGRWDTFIASVLFVAGFSLVFSVLGILLTTILNSAAYDVQIWLSRAGAEGLYLHVRLTR